MDLHVHMYKAKKAKEFYHNNPYKTAFLNKCSFG